MKKWSVVGIFLLVCSWPVYANDLFARIALVDLSNIYETFLKNSRLAQEVKELRREYEQTTDELNKEITTLNAASQQALRQNDQDAYRSIRGQLDEKASYLGEYRSLTMQRIEDVLEVIKKEDDQFIDVVLKSVERVARSEGLSLVLDKSDQEAILYHTEDMDITTKVADLIRRELGG